jgi:hypothetical protein
LSFAGILHFLLCPVLQFAGRFVQQPV